VRKTRFDFSWLCAVGFACDTEDASKMSNLLQDNVTVEPVSPSLPPFTRDSTAQTPP
jgi:hypothetical protein